jgi:hypothetical protein
MFRLTRNHGRLGTERLLAGGPFLLLVAACTSSLAPTGGSDPAASSESGSAPAIAAASAKASESAAQGTFASELYDYDIVLPAGWEPTAASSRWLSGALEGRCPSDWDCFTHGADGRTLAVAAIEVKGAPTLDQWRAQIHATQPDGCSDEGATSSTSLGGEPAQSWVLSCPSENLKTIKIVAIHGHQGYVLIFASPSDDALDADSSAFASLLDAFRFAA